MPSFRSRPTKKTMPSRGSRKKDRKPRYKENRMLGAKLRKARSVARKEEAAKDLQSVSPA